MRIGFQNLLIKMGYNNIILRKPQVAINDIYKDVDLLVLPSTELEGFGLVLIEAMSLGIPVIASNLECIKEIISDGQDGFIFKSGDYTKLIEKINLLFKDKNTYTNISINAILNIKNKFPIELTIRKYLKL